MSRVIVEGVSKRFGRQYAVDTVTLQVESGEFMTILGPSGSGKSTLLRLVAGLEVADAGRIMLGEEIVCGPGIWQPPQRRSIGMVFQNYALWPHMTAGENISFPLEMAHRPRDEIERRVQEVLALVELQGMEDRRPAEMSGGEQQRVALARALVGRPSILLMDECLSNLDARLRAKMADKIRGIQAEIGITTLYVTHDPQEALVLSDRLAVLHQGRLLQEGRAVELYRQPRSSLVASALGAVNLVEREHLRRLGVPLPAGDERLLAIRPEQVRLVPRQAHVPDSRARVSGRVEKSIFMGDSQHYWIDLGAFSIHARLPTGNGTPLPELSPGETVWLLLEPDHWIRLETTELESAEVVEVRQSADEWTVS